MPTILLLDEHQSTADGLSHWLPAEFDFSHVRQRSELLEVLEQKTFDLVITEMHFRHGEHGLRLMKLMQLRQVKFMVFCRFPGTALLRAAMLLGACGFVDKYDSLSDLDRAVEAILGGGSFFEADILQKIMQNPVKRLPRDITPGERKVIDQLYYRPPRTMSMIGRQIHLASGTVANRLLDVGRKLHVHGRDQILEKLLSLGYYPEIDPEFVEQMIPDKTE